MVNHCVDILCCSRIHEKTTGQQYYQNICIHNRYVCVYFFYNSKQLCSIRSCINLAIQAENSSIVKRQRQPVFMYAQNMQLLFVKINNIRKQVVHHCKWVLAVIQIQSPLLQLKDHVRTILATIDCINFMVFIHNAVYMDTKTYC